MILEGETGGDKYRIVRFVAEGGMAAVYEAGLDPADVIIEVLLPDMTGDDGAEAMKFLRPDLSLQRGVLERFQREAETGVCAPPLSSIRLGSSGAAELPNSRRIDLASCRCRPSRTIREIDNAATTPMRPDQEIH